MTPAHEPRSTADPTAGSVAVLNDADTFPDRVKEHGRMRALLESFAYLRPFGGMFGKSVPLYAESY